MFDEQRLRILAVITARKGSKRLPGKNKLELQGVPLISWTLETALQSELITDVLVSTDDAEIAEISKISGANVPWMRPDYLATDSASSVEVVLHAIDWYEMYIGKIDGVLLMQPTSPFRSLETIKEAVSAFELNPGSAIVAVKPGLNENSFYWNGFQLCDVKMNNSNLPADTNFLVLTGGLYLISPKILREYKSFTNVPTLLPVFAKSPGEEIDIDTQEDFASAIHWSSLNPHQKGISS
jgi:CMP-N-acetylneuraminic acid synthetase